MKIKILITVLFFSFLLLMSSEAEAQCAMCKAVLESNMQSGEQAVGKGINTGIMYIMFVPYILLAIAGYFMYKNYLKPQKAKD